jgi:putative ABC transport system permease protein
MTFVVRMALREIRASWRRLLFFFVCIAVGVASIVAIRSVIQSVREGLTREARAMTGADVVVRSDRPIGEKVRSAIDKERTIGRVSLVSEAVEIATMVRPPNTTTTRIVELRAVQQAYPLYGTMTLREGQYSHALLQGHGALVRPELLAQLNLRVGDDLLIGTQRFQIRGVIQNEPGRNLGAFSFGSRIFIDFADLQSTGLLSFGSRASYELLLQVPHPPPVPGRRDATTLLARDLSNTFVNDFVRARSYRQNEGRMSENLTRAENYLSLVGLVVLILGGIGVSSVTRVFVQQKVRSIAILKCVGSSTRQVLSVYLAQVLLLGSAGSVLGVMMAAGVLMILPLFVGDLAALLQVEYGLTFAAVLQGLAVGLLVSVLFSVVPLLEIRNVKPSLLLRQDMSSMPRFDWLKWSVAVAVAAALVGVAAWQAGSLAVGLVLSGGFVAIGFVLHLAGAVLVRAVQPLRHARSFALRQAVLRVARPGNQTRIILLAVGLGTFFILGVRGLQANLLRDFSLQVGEDAPDMFLMDIQQAQREGVTALVDRENGADGAPTLIPVLRARIVGVRGREVNTSRALRMCEGGEGWRGNSQSPTDRISHPMKPSSTACGGATDRRSMCPRSRLRKVCGRASRFSSATRCASTSSAASSRRAW